MGWHENSFINEHIHGSNQVAEFVDVYGSKAVVLLSSSVYFRRPSSGTRGQISEQMIQTLLKQVLCILTCPEE